MSPHSIPPDGVEHRFDLEGRDRIAELEARYRRVAKELRIAIGVFAAAVVVGLVVLFNVLDGVQAGRRAGVAITCAATNAIIDSGRATITGGAIGPPVFVRHLERLGLPSKAQRDAASRAAAAAYAKGVTDAVARASGDDARKVVRTDGTLRCEALQHISKTK